MRNEDDTGQPDDASGVPMHVLHVADEEVFGRLGRMIRELGLALWEDGVRASLLTDDARAAAAFDGTPIEDHYVSSLAKWPSWPLRRYLRTHFAEPPDLIHAWTMRGMPCISDWATACGLPLVIHCTSLADLDALCRRGLRDNELALGGCEAYNGMLHERWPTLPGAQHPIIPALLPPEAPPGISPRGNTLGILWAGRIDVHSGLDILVEALARLAAKKIEFHAVLVGAGPLTSTLWKQLRSHKLHEQVSLVDDPTLWDRSMRGADVLVLPAHARQVSTAAPLAMALGKLVIASDDQPAEWFIDGETCLLYGSTDVDQLVRGLLRAADRHPNVMALGRAAAKYAHEVFSVSVRSRELAELYRDFAAEVRTPARASHIAGER